MKFQRSIAATLAALLLALSVAGSAFAANQSTNITETLTVPATSSITGAPASIAYGSSLGGTSVVGTNTPGTPMVFTSNDANGFSIRMSSTDLTTVGGSTIVNTARTFAIQSVTPAVCTGLPPQLVQATLYADSTSGYHTTKVGGASDIWCNTSTPTSVTFTNFTAKIAIPAAQAGGAYTGTIIFNLVEL